MELCRYKIRHSGFGSLSTILLPRWLERIETITDAVRTGFLHAFQTVLEMWNRQINPTFYSGHFHFVLSFLKGQEEQRCTPDHWKAIGKNGVCVGLDAVDERCSDREMAVSRTDCEAFDGNWCCYGKIFLDENHHRGFGGNLSKRFSTT